MHPPAKNRVCLTCAFLRGVGRALGYLLLPRTFALLGGLVILALMAPSSLPPPPKPRDVLAAALPAALPASAALAALAAQAASAGLGSLAAQAASAAQAIATAARAAASAATLGLPAKVNVITTTTITVGADGTASAAASTRTTALLPLTAARPAAGPASATSATSATSAAFAASSVSAPSAATAVVAGVPAAAPVASASASAGAASKPPLDPAAAAPLALRYAGTTYLESGRVGKAWGPRRMVEFGKPPYTMTFVGPRPKWISEYASGTLSGTPEEAGDYIFTLSATSADAPQQPILQTFRVRVFGAGGAASKPVSKAAAKPAQGAMVKPKPEVDPTPAPITERDLVQTFRLDATDIAAWPWDDKLAQDEARGVEASPETPKPEQLTAMKKDWAAMLAPLSGIDYPSEAQFRAAVRLAHCSYYQEQARLAGAKPATAGSTTIVECPPLQRMAAAEEIQQPPSCALGLRPSPSNSYQALMSPAVRECLVLQARKPHPVRSLISNDLRAKPGCGCVVPSGEDEVQAFVSFWGSASQQVAAARAASAAASDPPAIARASLPEPEPRETDFSLFTRVNYFGALLNEAGDYDLPPAVLDQGFRLARLAHRHAVRATLVIYRNDWTLLNQGGWNPKLVPPERILSFIDRAALGAVSLADAEQPYRRKTLNSLLLPMLREPSHAWDGLTVFFDNAPPQGSEAGERFAVFYKRFVDKLIQVMQEKKRSYRLNIVVPGDRLGETGVFNIKGMNDWVEAAELPLTSKRIDAEMKRSYHGTTDIRLDYIVLLTDPATQAKKTLRERIDNSETLRGSSRVVLLQSLAPLLQSPPPLKPLWLSQEPDKQFDDDLAYMKWNFGGVALWELPTTAKEDADTVQHLETNYRVDGGRLSGLCSVVCPNRLELRLLLQLLVLVGAVSISLWVLNCSVRAIGRPYRIFMWVGGALTLPLAVAMLQCDPLLETVREGNVPLVLLLLAVFGIISYLTFKSHDELP